jgi:phosphatidylserine/phosphatidylglycerophosphate/cardiolipin synthase-like enzyme
MPDKRNEAVNPQLLAELYPFAEQAARALAYLGDFPDAISKSDRELAARIGHVSAQHVAIVRRALVSAGLAIKDMFSTRLAVEKATLNRLANNLEGVAGYLRVHKDDDTVRLVLTEPGEKSALRREINRRGLPPRLFQTRDAFMNLAHTAKTQLVVLAPFIDDKGAEFLIELFSACRTGVHRYLICRPLVETHCGPALRRRKEDFRRLGVLVYEYALPSPLPSGRETFHAKSVLVDDVAFYVGSSNFMVSALERSLECGVIVHGQSAKELYNVLEALRSVATHVDPSTW